MAGACQSLVYHLHLLGVGPFSTRVWLGVCLEFGRMFGVGLCVWSLVCVWSLGVCLEFGCAAGCTV